MTAQNLEHQLERQMKELRALLPERISLQEPAPELAACHAPLPGRALKEAGVDLLISERVEVLIPLASFQEEWPPGTFKIEFGWGYYDPHDREEPIFDVLAEVTPPTRDSPREWDLARGATHEQIREALQKSYPELDLERVIKSCQEITETSLAIYEKKQPRGGPPPEPMDPEELGRLLKSYSLTW